METLLQFKHIFKYYGDFAANIDINFEVKKGTIHSIIGENGAGKSTLMNVLAGVLTQSSGDIILNGKSLNMKDPNDATKNGIGMVQQEFMLFDNLTVIENIVLGHEDTKTKYWLDLKRSEKRILEICKKYHFNFPLYKKVSSLPIALQQQVEIVKVLFKQAEIIILDEPTAVLTPQQIDGLFEAMNYLIEQGKTILFITHKLNEVLKVSDYITVLRDGKVVDTIENESVSKEQLAQMMVGREVFLNIDRNEKAVSESILEIKDLTVLDEKHIARVKNMSFSLNKGEILGIVGVAGNGQNELIESITGLTKYSEGEILFKNEPLVKANPRNNRLKKIGYVPQNRIITGSALNTSLVDNIVMGKHLTDFTSKRGIMDFSKMNSYAQEVITKFSVKAQSIQDKASSLSGGNLQKLIVGREFSQDNEVLIIEDPTRGIDIGSIEFIWNEIKKIVEEDNVSVLLVSYDLYEAMSLSDRIIVVCDGRFVKEFKRNEFEEKRIGYYMLGGNDHEKESH